MQEPEFRVRPVVRYIVTKFTPGYTSPDGRDGHSSRSEIVGEFPNEETAYRVATAMGNVEPEWRNSLELAPTTPGGYVPGPQCADD